MNLPPLNALRAFEAAARNMGFSRAGDELNVTHVAISHHVKHLEEWLGCKLFHRTGRGVRLTEEGIELSERVSSNFRNLDEVCRRIRTSSKHPVLRVGCLPSIASRWLIPKLPEFLRAHPDIDIQVFYAAADAEILRTDWEVLITSNCTTSDDAEIIKVFSRTSKPVCSPRYLERNPSAIEPGEFPKLDLLHDESHQDWHCWFTAAGIHVSSELKGPIFQDFNLLATAVIAGHGIALCPVDVFREELSRGDLCLLSDLAVNEDQGYFIVCRKGEGDAVTNFLNWFQSATGQPVS